MSADDMVAAVFADFETAFLGGPSRLNDKIGGRTILSHTLRRLCLIEGVEHRCLYVRPAHAALAREALQTSGQVGIDLLPMDDAPRPRLELMRSARKWSLESWRGNICGATWFDEYVEPLAVARVLDHYGCDAVLCLSGCQPALDPGIASAMIRHKREQAGECRFVFTQAPPGLAGVLMRRDITREMLTGQMPLAMYLSYRPEIAQGDPITRANCLPIDSAISHTAARLTGDTLRSRRLLTEAFAELGEDCDAAALCRWLGDPARPAFDELPVEVEIELTTEDPLPRTTLRPRGKRVSPRTLTDVGAIFRFARELAALDDRRIVLGGFGDPLLHPEFAAICEGIRAAGICGIAVVTPLVELSDANLDALLSAKVDVLQVLLDAHSPATYQRMHEADQFETVISNLKRIQTAREQRSSPQPLIVPSITRAADTLPEIEAFFDHWVRATGTAVVTGYSHFSGRMPADSLLPMAPPLREPCRRLRQRLTLLADGGACPCDQDIKAELIVGNWHQTGPQDLWSNPAVSRIRTAHDMRDLASLGPCRNCSEWFRP
jgi:hypothetical protein